VEEDRNPEDVDGSLAERRREVVALARQRDRQSTRDEQESGRGDRGRVASDQRPEGADPAGQRGRPEENRVVEATRV